MNPAFDAVEYLILLSAETPDQKERRVLPPQIIHIDREHFLAWFEVASAPEAKGNRDTIRISLVAGAMQQHWTTICSDADRGMATCPDCDSCAYFGARNVWGGDAILSGAGCEVHCRPRVDRHGRSGPDEDQTSASSEIRRAESTRMSL